MPRLSQRLLSASAWVLLVIAVGAAAPAGGGSDPAPATPGYWQVATALELVQAVAAMPAVGGTVVIRPGTYALTTPLGFAQANHVNLVGSGWDTTLVRRGAGDVLVFQDCGFCEVRDLMIIGDAGAASGCGVVYRGQSSSNRLVHCRIANCPEDGVRYDGDPEGREGIYLNLLLGNTIHTNSKARAGEFAAVQAAFAADFTFSTNQVFSWDSEHYRHRSALVLGPGCRSWLVKDNILRHNTGPALVYDASAGHLVKDNLGE